MIQKTCFYFLLTIIAVIATRNVPMDEDTAKAQLITVIDDHCKLIHFDKKSINQLINYFHMKENIDNITACDLACEAYGTNKDKLAEVILKSDGDLHYTIKRFNKIFDAEFFQLQNDIITINIYAFNSMCQRTANYSVEQFGQKNKVAAYMLKNLLDVQNRTNYPVLKEQISRIQIPAEEIFLTLLPTLDSYHKFVRDYEMRDDDEDEHEIHNNGEMDDFEDDDEDFEAQTEMQNQNNETEVQPTEVVNNNKTETKETDASTIITTTTTEKVDVKPSDDDQPRLIDEFINSDLPLERLKEEFEKSKQNEARLETVEPFKGRGREISNIKGLYDTDDLDYSGIRNVGRARLEQDAARNAFPNNDNDDYYKYQPDTRDMGSDYSDSEESQEKDVGRDAAPQNSNTNKPESKPEQTKPTNTNKQESEPEQSKPINTEPKPDKPEANKQKPQQQTQPPNNQESEESDEEVHGRDMPVSDEADDDSDELPGSRDFYVSYESDESEEFDRIDQKSSSNSGGFLSFMTNPIKKGLAGVLKFGRNTAGGVLDGVNKLAVSVITKPDNWFERMVNYPKNFAVLRVIDSIHIGKKWMNNVLTPMIDGLEGKKSDDSRSSSPFTAFTNPIKNSIRTFVKSIGDGIISFYSKIPFVGGMIANGVNTTMQFVDGFLNRMFP